MTTYLPGADGIAVADTGAVRTFTIDRPDSRNGITPAHVRALKDAILAVADPIRVIVLTGAGGAFCSGLDLKATLGPTPTALVVTPEIERGVREDFHGLIRALVGQSRPTIAAVDGAAAGFGCDLALACDLRVVSDRAKFGEIFVRRGLMPDGGGTYLLPRIIGVGRALELMLTGDIVDAAEAHRIGLANRVVPAAAIASAVAELAATIAAGPPLVHRLVKHAVYAGLAGDLDAALGREADGQLALLRSADFAEGVQAFLDKRPPVFRGR